MLTVSLLTDESENSSTPSFTTDDDGPSVGISVPRGYSVFSDSDSDDEVADVDTRIPEPTDEQVQLPRPIIPNHVDEEMDTSDQSSDQSSRTAAAGENINTHIQQPEYTGEDRQEASALPEHQFVSYPFLVILRLWAVMCKIPAAQMDLLMKLLRKNNKYYEFAQLPKTWKTVVKLNEEDRTKYKVEEWGTAEIRARFAYVGIEKRLNQCRAMYISDENRGK
jgi:hypothetical protein